MPIHFIRGRLHVGYRKKDWASVWFEKIKVSNARNRSRSNTASDEGTDATLEPVFKFTIGRGNSLELPVDGEIVWLPQFDPKNCETEKASDKRNMQQRFLQDGHRYLTERDPAGVQKMEQDWNLPTFARWNMWFEDAKKWRKSHVKQKQRRRQCREQTARAEGVAEVNIAASVDSDTSEDSAYESQEERTGGPARVSMEDMPPPARPNKRPRSNGGVGAGDFGSTTSFPGAHRQAYHFMSGGLGKVRGRPFTMSGGLGEPFTMNGGVGNPAIKTEDKDDMDTRDPTIQGTPPTTIQQDWRLPLSASSFGPRRRGRSTSANPATQRDPLEDYGNGDDHPGSELAQQQRDAFSDDEAALDEAIRQSQEPEHQMGPFQNEEEALNEALRQSRREWPEE
ncbi:hypothetical protein BDY17DRAFT_308957 [Neohortaea acidophila]|uniref:Uncharacterized protein n=1 Tax=Neohortaea acidophila TaxID=245834 RepID=A0A6A6Q0T4_9PEZI|nr:uncharacterized protein BDY17DRAFT_308957 [Neohortaea acidophila]KAF2485604.1 hypothetical protein BDY17DRAFT_308957 [Neohortaea acidophila]